MQDFFKGPDFISQTVGQAQGTGDKYPLVEQALSSAKELLVITKVYIPLMYP